MKKILFILILAVSFWNFNFGQEMSQPIRLVHTTNGSRWAQVALGPDGVAHVVWEEDLYTGPGHEIMYVSYDGKTISSPINLKTKPDVRGLRPSISCSRKGGVFVVWNQEEIVYLREYDPVGKKWLSIEEVGPCYGGDCEQLVALDPSGNIHVVWFSDSAGKTYARSKINGVWEEIKRLSPPGVRGVQCAVVAAKDGQIWAVWREKGGGGEYKNFYSKRRANSDWSAGKRVNDAGASVSHPHMAIGPDNVPVIVNGDIDESTGHSQEIWICTLDEKTNPRELAIALGLQHYPRIAIDKNRKKHVAVQIGGGDFGDGVKYTNNIQGTWKAPVTFGAVWPKLPGISADAFGNVALAWASMPEGNTGIWLSSLYPIVRKEFFPPLNLKATASFKLGETTEVTYNFSWEKNSKNNDNDLEGYNIYKKEGSGNYELLLSLSKSTTSGSFTFSTFKEDLQFGITTVALSSLESEIGAFELTYPPIYPPSAMAATISLTNVKTSTKVTYNLSWQANPQNSSEYVKSYSIYKKEGDGNFELVQTLSKSTFSASFTFSNPQKKIQFGIKTVSVVGRESDLAIFGSQ